MQYKIFDSFLIFKGEINQWDRVRRRKVIENAIKHPFRVVKFVIRSRFFMPNYTMKN